MGHVGSACKRGSRRDGYEAVNVSSDKFIGQASPSVDQDDDCSFRPEGLSEDEYLAQVAGGKASTILSKMELGYCGVEHGSVYGAAMVMPQVARSVGWSIRETVLALRSFFFLFLNIFIQGYLLYMLSTEQLVTSKFAGRMHLCDFGATLDRCPGRTDCFGPGGSQYTLERLYHYSEWNTRSYVAQAFKHIFPEREEEISSNIDPGEYGMQSYHCRIVCCCVYILALIGDIEGTLEMCKLIYYVPSEAEPWISYDLPKWGSKEYAKKLHSWTELDLVSFKVAGMPFMWKVINVLFVITPKLFIWRKMLQVGITFLMETATIVELIVNAMALTFVLSMDEVICTILMSSSTKYILLKLENYPLFETSDEEHDSMKDAFDKHSADLKWSVMSLRFWDLFLPRKFFLVIALTAAAVYEYYYIYCVYDGDLGWISKSLHLPVNWRLNVLTYIMPYLWPVQQEDAATWVMPDTASDIPAPIPAQ